MPDIEFRRGRKKPHADTSEHRRLKLRHFLEPGRLPAVPPVIDWVSKVDDWPMYLNDRYGDCVWAMIGHSIEAFTQYGEGRTEKITDADVIKGYSDVEGFDPDDPSTDNGTVIQDALDYWRKVGVGGHKILAFAQVDHENMHEVFAAMYLFGHLQLGINFPGSAMEQFNNGQVWDVVPGAVDDGGHAVCLGYAKNDKGGIEWDSISWAQRVRMTEKFFTTYVEEAWVVVSPEWMDAAGNSPEGINTATLGEAFQELTGDPSPFPFNPPPPAPPGPQPPPPVGMMTPAEQALFEAQQQWRADRGFDQ